MASRPPYLALFVFSPGAGVLAALFGLMVYDREGPWLGLGPAAVLSAWALIALWGTLGVCPRAGMAWHWTCIATCSVLFLYGALLWWIVGHMP